MRDRKTMLLTVSYTVEVSVDERINEQDMRHAAHMTFHEYSDGRNMLSVEMMRKMLAETCEVFAIVATSALADRICSKYPGGHQKGYMLEELLPKPLPMWHIKGPRVLIDGRPATEDDAEQERWPRSLETETDY